VIVIRIWDLPTRMFHWLFAIACIVAWFTGDDARYTDLHTFTGYTALALLGFRLLWGMVGGRYARFTQFVRGPAAVVAHLRELVHPPRQHHLGHNPAGGWAVVVLLTLVGLLGLSGIAVLGGEEGFGPLAGWLSIGQGVAIHAWHEALAWVLLGMVALHLGGVALESLLQRENLPRAMITGNKAGTSGQAEPHNAPLPALAILGGLFLFALLSLKPYLSGSEDNPYQPFALAPLVQDPLWQESCGECHIAYHPSVLPQRSWERLLAEQGDHFDEALGLSGEDVTALLTYARANSAEQVEREHAWRMRHSLEATETPLRITETRYWKQTHTEIDDAVWRQENVNGRLNCATCHRDAEQGGFNNGAMSIVALPR
jgi:cytochrome b